MGKRARSWGIAFAAVAAAGLTLALGFWQWDRAQQKVATQAAREARAALPVLGADALREPLEPMRERRVELHGRWIADRTVFLDNRQMQGRPGFYVVTPLEVIPGGTVVLVQRGWAPRDFTDRRRLPPVETPAGVVTVSGRIAAPPSRLYEFASDEHGAIRQNLDLVRFRNETRLPLVDGSVQQTGPASEGLRRDWPAVASGADKNRGYAFQWWLLSALVAILYVWFQIIRPRRAVRVP